MVEKPRYCDHPGVSQGIYLRAVQRYERVIARIRGNSTRMLHPKSAFSCTVGYEGDKRVITA